MNLITIHEVKGKKAVSARELHAFLESKRDFSNWIKDRIEKYGLIENQDFEVFNKFGENSNGGRPSIEYALSLDCAKEISMVEGNEKGRQARRYFLECEKKLQAVSNHYIPQSYSDALKLAYEQSLKIEQQQKQIEEQAPKVIFTDSVIGSQSSCLIGELAKILNQNGIDIGQNRLFEWLRENGYLGRKGERRNIPNQQYIQLGIFELKKGIRTGSAGELYTTITPKVTGKGQVYFLNKFMQHKINVPEYQ